jgi:hypothetical protein
VVDFIHVQVPHVFSFAVFNVADSAIFVGVIGLALLLWRGVPPTTRAAAQGAPPNSETPPAAPPPCVPNPHLQMR